MPAGRGNRPAAEGVRPEGPSAGIGGPPAEPEARDEGPHDEQPADEGWLDDEAVEVAPARVPPGGRRPSRQEVERHVATGHAVHRDWCFSCMRGRGLATRHEPAGDDREDADPLVCMDYGYMLDHESEQGQARQQHGDGERDDEDPDGMLIVVAKDRRTGTYGSTALRAKGVTDHSCKWLAGFLKHLGYRRLVLHSDGEPSICALKTATVLRLAGVEVVARESPVGDHQANGEAECAVREIKRQIRVLRYALEERIGGPVRKDHPILSWLPMLAADSLSRYRVGRDGRTAEVRRIGRPWKKLVAEFGERVRFRPALAEPLASGMQAKLQTGYYIGHHARTGSLLVMTAGGVVKAVGFRRLPLWKTAGRARTGMP